MSSREKSTPSAPPGPPPEPFHDPEVERPFREAFARRLPPDKRRELEEAARAAYHEALESQSEHAHPDASDTWGMLRAAAVDLRETALLLSAVEAEHQGSALGWLDTAYSMLAAPRRLEVEAVAERVEAVVAFVPSLARLFPAELVTAAITPSTYQDAPLDHSA